MIPCIGDKGLYTVKEPFNKFVDPNISYTCIAIRTISDYVINGVDIQNLIYRGCGLLDDDYIRDLDRDEFIATIQSTLGDTIQIPCGYILKMPDPNGRVYRNLVMSVNLGKLPANLKLGTLCNDIKDFVSSRLGITPDVQVIEIDKPHVVSSSEHMLLEHERYNRIENMDSNSAQIKRLSKENSSLIGIVKRLQDEIIKLKKA